MRPRHALWAAVLVCAGNSALAQTQPATQFDYVISPDSVAPATAAITIPSTSPLDIPAEAATTPGQLANVVVTSDLNQSRSQIAPSLGATTYTIDKEQIQNIPMGENATFQQLLLRAPGVVQDSFGQTHVRGEHANLTYRVNGVLLPQGLTGFGQELDTRLIDSLTLIDGNLPAQFGFRTAGIVDVNTKSGEGLKHNEISLYGGSYNTFEPSAEFGGTLGKLDYFVTGSLKHNNLGIENTTSSYRAIHDDTDQQRLFAYLSYHIDDTSRLSVLLNAANADFQIPGTAGLTPAFALAGHPHTTSAATDENQNEQEYYSVLSYQKTAGELAFQVSYFARYGQIHFTPDVVNDPIFQGVAGDVLNYFSTNGVQADASYIVNDQHTIRTGLIGDFTAERLDTNDSIFTTDPTTGVPTSNRTTNIADNSGNHGSSVGVYLQDEWSLTKTLTLNYGLRYDRFDTNFADSGQLSPRVNLVWKVNEPTVIHLGYSRYFVPPPLQWVQPASISRFASTTNAPENFRDDPPKVERSHYFDAGISGQIMPAWHINLDGFFKTAHNLVDNGQFGAPVILSTFNYRIGTVYGAELSSDFTRGGFTAYGNFSWVITKGRDINSNQFLFASDELAFIRTHDIKLDHEANYTASVGISYAWKHDRIYADVLYGSGLRAGFANTQKEPEYAPVNIGYEHVFRTGGVDGNTVRARIDLINVFDSSYQLRDGTGLGVNAAQYGARRGVFVGLTYEF